MAAQGGSLQVERVLDDLIQRLTDREKTPEVRAALIEARRLKNVTTRWAAIPPPPDARREMLTRVMELVSSVGSPLPNSSPPSPPPASGPSRSTSPESGRGPESRRSPFAHAPTEAALSAVDGSAPPPARTSAPGSAPKGPAPRAGDEFEFDAAPQKDLRRRTPGDFGLSTPAPPAPRPATPRPGDFGARATSTLTGFESASTEVTPTPSSRRSAIPTAPPPDPAASLGPTPRPASSQKNAVPSAPGSPRPFGGFGENRSRTLAQGSLGVSQALEALADAKRPKLPTIDDPPTEPEPAAAFRRAETKELEITPAPPATRAARTTLTSSQNGIRAVTPTSDGKLEGFSKQVSMTGIPAVRSAPKMPTFGPASPAGGRPPSNPTQTLFGAGIQQALKDAQKQTPPPSSTRSRPGSIAPPPGLRTLVAPGVSIIRPDAVEWQPHASAVGVTIKTLYRDPRSGIYTALIRFAPGAALPRRRHASAEEMFVVSGTALRGDHEIKTGEYSRAESETVTESLRSPSGCTIFVCGSENDELLDDA